jgi:integrase
MLDPLHSLILSYALPLQREGYREPTIDSTVRSLKAIAKHVDLLNPNGVKDHVYSLKVTESRKERLVIYLSGFYKFKKIEWTSPRYRRVQRLPWIPTEEEANQLIAGLGKKSSCFMQILKETAIRPGECWNLRWIDVDTEKETISVLPEKDSNPRICKVSSRTITMIQRQPKDYPFVFRNPAVNSHHSLDRFRAVFDRQRKRIALKLGNPRIQQISFKTMRHYKASMFYHSTRDILATMQLLGHKNIRNTLVYTHLVQFESDEFVCKAAKTVEEAKAFVESGFEYVTDVEGYKLFKKRK